MAKLIEKTYGDALFELAMEKGSLDSYFSQCKDILQAILDNEELLKLLSHPKITKEEKVKVINATVADLRLDAVAAAGYGVSRSRMSDEIKSLNVKLNWKEAKKAAQAVNEGDVISFRGRGRVEVAEIRGTTKKGRISVTLKRFI